MSRTFPPEIIDYILSFLQRDHATLKACTRAHPLLAKLVERHFYRHLILQNYDPCPAGAYRRLNLLKLTLDNPNIANQVRSLRICIRGWFWPEIEPLESILSSATQLQTISLSSFTKMTDWGSLCKSFRDAFINCLQRPTVTYIEMSKIAGFPFSALDGTISLKGLSLWGGFSYFPPASSIVYSPLDYLCLSNCSSTSMGLIASWLGSRGVHSLRLNHSFEWSPRLLEVCANTLTTLIVDVPFGGAIPLSLSCLPHLARLTVQIPITSTRSSNLLAAMHLLDTLPSPPTKLALLVISVKITIDATNPLDDDISDTDWSSLIAFPYFDVIPRVELRVRARKSGKRVPLVELLGELKQDPQLMQLEMHQSFVINAVEKSDDDGSWFHHFVSD